MNTFNRRLSLRIDAIQHAIDTVQAWPDGSTKRTALGVLRRVMGELQRGIGSHGDQ